MRPKLPKYSLNKVFELLTIIVLIIALILVIYYIKFNNSSKNENFSVDLIEIKSNFYDITDSGSSVLNNLGFPLAGSQVCIYNTETDDRTNKEFIKEMECITAGELSNGLKLPKFRKEHICIDEECLGYKDLEILTGDLNNKFKISHHSSDRGPNASHTNCLAKKRINFVSCSNQAFPDGVLTLGLRGCNEDNINYYTIHDTRFNSSGVAEDVQNMQVQNQETPQIRGPNH